ncbi:MAG: PorP/SprF family type IX secretion system membrane protein [Crocinitomicaceae bacterium]
MKALAIQFGFAILVSISSLNAQLDPSFRQNQFNVLVLNPAQTGANDRNEISINALKSWVGVAGAPKTISAMGNFNVTDQLGLGVIVMNDEIGPVKSNRISLSSAYHLKLNRKWMASVGISGMVANVVVDRPSVSTTELNDPHMQSILNSGSQLRAGFGGLLYTKNFYVGASQPLIGSVKFAFTNMNQYVPNPSVVAYTGGIIKMNNQWNFRPNLVYRYVKAFPVYLDATALFTYDKKIDMGLTYQLKGAFGAILGIEINKALYVGYSYTYPTTRLNTVTSQSHELAVRMRFGKSKKKYGFQNPRFFN